MDTESKILRYTESVCPECLRTLDAVLHEQGEAVFLCRTCPEHGKFEEIIWRGSPTFESWSRPKHQDSIFLRQTKSLAGCPHDCGLCSNHGQKSCAVLYELTESCNLNCPVCFAASEPKQATFISLAEHLEAINWIYTQAGQAVLQLSGGEPTLYPDLIPLVREAAKLFPAVQLNTNGLLLASKPDLAKELADAGLNWVFLQFDGTLEHINIALRGRALLTEKMQAIENCRQAGLAVVLVPTLARGINENNLGELVQLAISLHPVVRGVHIQPMTRSGRNAFDNTYTITLPEVLQLLEKQSKGLVTAALASPPGCEHERCSFHIRYAFQAGAATPTPVTTRLSCCSDKPDYLQGISSSLKPESAAEGAERAIAAVINNWKSAEVDKNQIHDAFDRFIASRRANTFSLTCMAFQDVWNLDLERLRGCCIHVFHSDAKKHRRLIPFCAYNLTDSKGKGVYRKTK